MHSLKFWKTAGWNGTPVKSQMKNPKTRLRKPRRQGGAIFLALMLILIVTGSTFVLGALNNRQAASLAYKQEVRYQMEQAKAALLAYAANYATFYTDRGPGFFPCPDTDAPTSDPDGEPNYTSTVDYCSYDAAPALGRLPRMETFTSTTFRLNDTYADVDRQFWYAVAPRYLYSSTNLNRRSYTRTYSNSAVSTIASSKWLTLDGTTKYVALIIAPGEELDGQDRINGPTNYANYLDGQNGGDGFNFYTRYDSNPELFNDEILGITLDEYMIHVGTAVARAVKSRLDQYYLLNVPGNSPTRYPTSSSAAVPDTFGTCSTSTFSNIFDGTTYGTANVWLRDSTSGNNNERWACRQNMTWTRDSGTGVNYGEGYLVFSGCPNIKFRIEYASANVKREGDTCL
jgi:hypothetical protein